VGIVYMYVGRFVFLATDKGIEVVGSDWLTEDVWVLLVVMPEPSYILCHQIHVCVHIALGSPQEKAKAERMGVAWAEFMTTLIIW
jgi:hypothetical protein